MGDLQSSTRARCSADMPAPPRGPRRSRIWCSPRTRRRFSCHGSRGTQPLKSDIDQEPHRGDGPNDRSARQEQQRCICRARDPTATHRLFALFAHTRYCIRRRVTGRISASAQASRLHPAGETPASQFQRDSETASRVFLSRPPRGAGYNRVMKRESSNRRSELSDFLLMPPAAVLTALGMVVPEYWLLFVVSAFVAMLVSGCVRASRRRA